MYCMFYIDYLFDRIIIRCFHFSRWALILSVCTTFVQGGEFKKIKLLKKQTKKHCYENRYINLKKNRWGIQLKVRFLIWEWGLSFFAPNLWRDVKGLGYPYGIRFWTDRTGTASFAAFTFCIHTYGRITVCLYMIFHFIVAFAYRVCGILASCLLV